MKQMTYKDACNTYYGITLDAAKRYSTYIFDVIGVCAFDGIDDSIKDVYDNWIALRRTIVEELREL